MRTTSPRALLSRAATLHARGLTLQEVADALRIDKNEVERLRRRRDEWDYIFDAAMHKLAMRCALLVGTDEARRDAAAFLLDAERAEVWAQAWMGEGFTLRGGDTLTRYYLDHYRPACMGEVSADTLNAHHVCLRRWRLLMGDPLLAEITTAMLAQFHAAMQQVVGAQRAQQALRFITTVYQHSRELG